MATAPSAEIFHIFPISEEAFYEVTSADGSDACFPLELLSVVCPLRSLHTSNVPSLAEQQEGSREFSLQCRTVRPACVVEWDSWGVQGF